MWRWLRRRRPELIVSAHDGYPRWVDSGADFIELDIRRDENNVIVLAHDEVVAGTRHVTFAEALRDIDGRIGVQLDLKEPGYERDVVDLALSHLAPEKIVVTTESAGSASQIKSAYPTVRVGITASDVKATGADFAPIEHRYAYDRMLDLCARSGIPVWVWTVDTTRQLKRFAYDRRVAGVITNRPDIALRLRGARSPKMPDG